MLLQLVLNSALNTRVFFLPTFRCLNIRWNTLLLVFDISFLSVGISDEILLLVFDILLLDVWMSDETLLLVFDILLFRVWISDKTLLSVFDIDQELTLLISSKVRLWLFRLAQSCASAINSATYTCATKHTYYGLNHNNYHKIRKSDWLSTVLISALIGQYASCLSNWTVLPAPF